MILRTRIFELYHDRYKNLTQLAKAMGISVSQIYRVRQGKRKINQSFLTGAIKAFPQYKIGDLFYFTNDAPTVHAKYKYVGQNACPAAKLVAREARQNIAQ